MFTKLHIAALALALSACSSNVTVIEPLRLQMEHHGEMKVTPINTDGNYFEISDDDFSASVFMKKYDIPSDGIEDHSMSSTVVAKMKQAKRCDGELPIVNLSKPNICKWDVSSDGVPIIYAVGFNYPYEGYDYPAAVIVILRTSDFVILQVPSVFPQLDAELQKESDVFYKANPHDDLWPPRTVAAQAFYTHATKLVERLIKDPSSDAAYEMSILEKIVQKIKKADY